MAFSGNAAAQDRERLLHQREADINDDINSLATRAYKTIVRGENRTTDGGLVKDTAEWKATQMREKQESRRLYDELRGVDNRLPREPSTCETLVKDEDGFILRDFTTRRKCRESASLKKLVGGLVGAAIIITIIVVIVKKSK